MSGRKAGLSTEQPAYSLMQDGTEESAMTRESRCGVILLLILAVSGCSRSALNGGPEDPAIRLVEGLGGECRRPAYYEDGYKPDWLEAVEGAPVVAVDFQSARGRVTDATLARMHPLKELRALNLHSAEVTGPGLKHLRPFARLADLELFKTKVTDDGLSHLAGLEALEELSLSATAVTDEGMKHVAQIAGLKKLDLDWTNVGDAGLGELVALRLVELSLWDTRITDAGIGHIVGHAGLQSLTLKGTAVTDKGVQALARLRRLRFLSLDADRVTKRAATELAKALPDCGVWHDSKQVLAP